MYIYNGLTERTTLLCRHRGGAERGREVYCPTVDGEREDRGGGYAVGLSYVLSRAADVDFFILFFSRYLCYININNTI